MSKMKDLMIESHNLGLDWDRLLEKILSQNAIGRATITKPDEAPADEEEWEAIRHLPDLSFVPKGTTQHAAIEFKMFRWSTDWPRRLREAVAHMRELIETTAYDFGIIIVSREIPEGQLSRFKAALPANISIWDLAKLRELVIGNDELQDALEDLVSDTVLDGYIESTPRPEPEVPQGLKLARRLRQTQPGRPGWRPFEICCDEAIRFLFGRDLSNFVTQQRTDDDLNRMDLIARIKPVNNTFWSMISADFSTRYIVFDAKNYKAPINQHEITITGKYLFAKGLRTVAIIIAREGADDTAVNAAQALLRETGKLILVLSMANLCHMLEGADAGDPPENVLFALMDEMLMKMGC